MIDTTKRREAEERAHEAEERFRVLAEHVPAITYVWRIDPQPDSGEPTAYVSSQVERILGYTVEEWSSHPSFWKSCLHPDDREWATARMAELESSGEPWSLQYRMIAKDGRIVWIRDEGRLAKADERGRITYLQGVLIDVTDRRDSDERLQQAELKYQTLVEQIPAITYVEEVDRMEPGGSRMVYLSPQTQLTLGFTPEELLESPERFPELIHPEDRKQLEAAMSALEGNVWDELIPPEARRTPGARPVAEPEEMVLLELLADSASSWSQALDSRGWMLPDLSKEFLCLSARWYRTHAG